MEELGEEWQKRLQRESELRAKWQAVAYRLVGMGVAVDDRLAWCLAALVGRDADAVNVLYSGITSTLSPDRKLSQLRELTAGDPSAGPLLDAASTSIRVRNLLAHSTIVGQPTLSSVKFESTYRGRRTECRLWDVEAWILVRGQEQLMDALWALAVRQLDAPLALSLLGYSPEEASG
ncbi:hypothetical protein LG324_08815 [Phycicoccus jejuensis]|uniref:hypothetical protein n=1 Tax=Phycicoccus jejuensis TaxID=367299 RepID=UPI00384EB3FA